MGCRAGCMMCNQKCNVHSSTRGTPSRGSGSAQGSASLLAAAESAASPLVTWSHSVPLADLTPPRSSSSIDLRRSDPLSPQQLQLTCTCALGHLPFSRLSSTPPSGDSPKVQLPPPYSKQWQPWLTLRLFQNKP